MKYILLFSVMKNNYYGSNDLGISYNFWWYCFNTNYSSNGTNRTRTYNFSVMSRTFYQLKYCSVYDKNLGARVELALFNRLPIVSTNSFQQDLNIKLGWGNLNPRKNVWVKARCVKPLRHTPL